MTYLVGAAQCLMSAVTWNSDDENVVQTTISNARVLISAMMNLDECPMAIQFRPDPAYPQNFQYSLDGGATWLTGPDTASSFTPQFLVDSGAPGGYDLSVNGDHSSTPFPSLTATDPDAVITDPTTLLRNLITASGSAEGLAVQALATIGVQLVKGNGVALALNKIPGFGLATSALETLAAGSDYTFNLIEVE